MYNNNIYIYTHFCHVKIIIPPVINFLFRPVISYKPINGILLVCFCVERETSSAADQINMCMCVCIFCFVLHYANTVERSIDCDYTQPTLDSHCWKPEPWSWHGGEESRFLRNILTDDLTAVLVIILNPVRIYSKSTWAGSLFITCAHCHIVHFMSSQQAKHIQLSCSLNTWKQLSSKLSQPDYNGTITALQTIDNHTVFALINQHPFL